MEKTNDVSKAASLVDAKYAVTGGIQVLGDLARVHVQVIDLYSSSQVLSCMYEDGFSSQHIFKLQDEIVQFIISEMSRSRKLAIKNKTTCRPLVAVA